MGGTSTLTTSRVSVLKLVRDAYAEVWRAPVIVVRLGLVISLAGFAFVYLSHMARLMWWAPEEPPPLGLELAHDVAVMALVANLAVGWHRYVLRGETPDSYRPRWTMVHTRLWGWSVLLASMLRAPELILAPFEPEASPYLLALVAMLLLVVTLYLDARLSLVLPATALSHPASLSRSWRSTTGNGCRIAIAYCLVLFPLAIAFLPAADFMNDSLEPGAFDPIRGGVTLAAVWVTFPFFTCLEIGILSHAYRHLVEPAPG